MSFRAQPSCALFGLFSFFVVACLPGCGESADSEALAQWLEQSNAVEVGTLVQGAAQGPAGGGQLRAAGFSHVGYDNWERRVALSVPPTLEPLSAPELPSIGAVSVLSVDRQNGREPYLYATLKSLFAQLPPHSVVNVFVGSNKQMYVSPLVLAAAIGFDAAQRVNVVGTDDAVMDFMQASAFDLSERASWNYARMLRAYQGDSFHLTFEDDVLLAEGSIQVLDKLLAQQQAHTVSMYNHKCGRCPGFDKAAGAHIATYRRDKHKSSFWGTQGVAYRGEEGRAVGRYIQTHLGEKPFDLLVDGYLNSNKRALGYVQPSMVQHMGVVTTGLGYHHTSSCFAEQFPTE